MTDRTSCVYPDPNRPRVLRCTECGFVLAECPCENPEDIANDRFSTRKGLVLTHAWARIRESKKVSNVHNVANLAVAVGDLTRMLLVHDEVSRPSLLEPTSPEEAPPSSQRIYTKVIEVIELAVRIAAEGDDDYSYDPASIFETFL